MCDWCARTFSGQSGSFRARFWVHIAQNTAERRLFRLFSRPASTKQPRIAKGSPPGVHMHVCEVFLYLLDYCGRFADLGARFWCQSRDSEHILRSQLVVGQPNGPDIAAPLAGTIVGSHLALCESSSLPGAPRTLV